MEVFTQRYDMKMQDFGRRTKLVLAIYLDFRMIMIMIME